MCLYSELKPRRAREETVKAACVFTQTRTNKISHPMLALQSIKSDKVTCQCRYLTTGLYHFDFLIICTFQSVTAAQDFVAMST